MNVSFCIFRIYLFLLKFRNIVSVILPLKTLKESSKATFIKIGQRFYTVTFLKVKVFNFRITCCLFVELYNSWYTTTGVKIYLV